MRFQLLHFPLSLMLVIALLATSVQGAFATDFNALPVVPGQQEVSGFNMAYMFTIVKKKKKKRKKRRTRRRYTLRGNPEVTRKVATQLIAEKLPELAELVGIDPIVPAQESASTSVAIDDSEDPNVGTPGATISAPVAGSKTTATKETAQTASRTTGTQSQSTPVSRTSLNIPTTGVVTAAPSQPDYDDSELSEQEDPDQLTEEDEEMLDEDEELNILAFYDEFTDYMASLNGTTHITDNGIDKEVAMEALMNWLGTRYLFGGTSEKGIDCSAFTRTMYGTLGCKLPRTAAMQWGVGEEVDYENLQFGDLIFFNTRKAVYVSHVGMYLGNGMFAHASSRNGVTVSSLESNYYSTHFIGARRYDVAAAVAEAEAKALASRQGASDTTRVQ